MPKSPSPESSNQPLRILHTNMHKGWGGQPNRILTTARGLVDRGHKVVLCGPRGAELHKRAAEYGIPAFEELDLARGFRPWSQLPDIRRMKAHLAENNYDIIDTHGSQDTWTVVMALLDKQMPGMVRTRHNVFPVKQHPFNKWMYGKFDHIITISPQVIPLLAGLLPPDCYTSIYSAPDPARFDIADSREDVRAEFGYAPSDEVVGVVARLAPEKGHAILLDAAPRILRERPNARFLFIGKGRSRPALEEQVSRLGIADRVTFAGFRTDVPRLLKGLDLFVLPCIDGESLGTSILEAFLMEVPVVACDVGGVSESVRDGETGRLVKPNRNGPLAEAIVEMLGNAERSKQWALAGKALVQAEFTPERIAEQTEEVYRKVLARRQG